MQVLAKHRYARVSAQKARLVARRVAGQSVESAFNTLSFSRKKSAVLIKKTLESAVANAENNEGADVDALFVGKVLVDDGPIVKRVRARAKGRANKISRRTSHITILVEER